MANERPELRARDGGVFSSYLSNPGGPRRPGIVVCTEVFGVNSHMRSVADRLAGAGYVVLVPDLFWRIEPGMEIAYNEAGLKRGAEILAKFDVDKGVEDLGEAVKFLRKHPACTGKVGVIGFCIGGAVAYLAAARLGVDAAVGYYGKGIDERLAEANNIRCPLTLHFGGADRYIPQTVVKKIEAELRDKPNIKIYLYPGVDHGFNSEDRKAYNAEVAQTAMQRTLAVFQAALAN
jgi:carboxymethylenebutenolidase